MTWPTTSFAVAVGDQLKACENLYAASVQAVEDVMGEAEQAIVLRLDTYATGNEMRTPLAVVTKPLPPVVSP